MARPHHDVAPELSASLFFPAAQATLWWLQPLVDAQRLQWNALLDWQRSLATMNGDLWDQWAVRFMGGAPLDG